MVNIKQFDLLPGVNLKEKDKDICVDFLHSVCPPRKEDTRDNSSTA